MTTSELAEISRWIRRQLVISTTAAGSGHLTSSLSAVELMTALLFGGTFRADLKKPEYPNSDRLIFSKGHAAPLLYALYAAGGRVSPKELLTLRKFGSRLEGHPTPRFPYTEMPTGSLGQGLPGALGEALGARMMKLPYRVYCLLGDSEMAEGSVWEAIQLAGWLGVKNLVGIIDVNGLGQSGPTMFDAAGLAKRVQAFGWKTITVDGHDLKKIIEAYVAAEQTKDVPTMIIAKTIKGKGVALVEGQPDWHGKALSKEQASQALKELGNGTAIKGIVAAPLKKQPTLPKRRAAKVMRYALGQMVSPRLALGQALVRLAPATPQLVVLDGEVKNSTFTEWFAKKFASRFIEGYIAEQNIVGLATGLARRGLIPVSATFAAFWTRAFDQLRMAAYSGTHQIFIGTHAGVHIGQDGTSQMGLQDIALFRTLEHSVVLYPADAVAAEKLLEKSIKFSGLVYLRATRADLPVIYKPTQRFIVGGSNVLRQSTNDQVTIVAAGVTLFEALKAADHLAKKKIMVRVIDLYSIKPIDAATLRLAARQTKRLIVVEDHYPEGGMAEAVRSALGKSAGVVSSLAVTKSPRSGKPAELLSYEKIDAAAIIDMVQKQ